MTGARYLLAAVLQHRRPLRRLVLWSGFEMLPMLLSGQLVARALDHGFLAGRPELGVGYLAVFGATYALSALAVRQSYPATGAIVEPLRDGLVHLVVASTLRRAVAGRERADQAAVARMVHQVEAVRDATAGLLIVLRHVVFALAATTVGLLTVAPVLLRYVLPPLALSLMIFGGLMVVIARRQRDVVLAGERISAAAGPVLEGLPDVVALGAEQDLARAVGTTVDRQFAASSALARVGALRTGIVALGVQLPVLLILLAAPSLVRGGLSAGAVVGAITYLTVSLQPALRALVQGLAATWVRLSVALQRILETSEVPEGSAGGVARAPRGYRVELHRVTFTYGGAEPVINELNLVVAEDEHLAIVGPSGAGKSTLAALLAGVESPQAGVVRIGGMALTGLAGSAVRASVVLIPQEAYVFAADLMDNIGYLRPGLAESEVDRVVELLGLGPLRDRAGGYREPLRPTALSAGERQLIALARAYVCAAPIAVLDEATCHLDPATEARVEQAFASRPGTLVVIAHRISSAMRARRIVYLDDGEPVVATHDRLLACSPRYRDMVRQWDPALVVAGQEPLPAYRP